MKTITTVVCHGPCSIVLHIKCSALLFLYLLLLLNVFKLPDVGLVLVYICI